MTGRFPALAACALAVVAAVAATPGLAQSPAPDLDKDMWCGLAFLIIAEQAPSDATDEQKSLAGSYARGGTLLVERASAATLEDGVPPEHLDDSIDKLRAEVEAQVNTATAAPTYSFEECRVLLPF